MVLFININRNQRVEVDYNGDIHTGVVKYKGSLNGVSGDWVGVALDRAVGEHDGLLTGRRYFFCRPNHGIFTTADRIRFVPLKRSRYDNYRPISRQSQVDEALFTSYANKMIEEERDPVSRMSWISETYMDRANKVFPDPLSSDHQRDFRLSHTVSAHIPACTMMRPQTSPLHLVCTCVHQPECRSARRASLSVMEAADLDPWIHPPSIPKTHMPHSVLQRQVARGWSDAHYVREMSMHTGRDSIKFDAWNDISE